MKKFYTSPEFEVTHLTPAEIINASLELDDEVEIDGGDLWS